ncbi:MAG: D-alanyl-D-alanine carboxypeptidase/D-alanyl-D-alanine-endopeptidase [Betaproteobacteria bacterium]|nr:D-alanyl-D-alanine carboxypeptidase/D-alanyl-D-alanine-endopeptidase [Betaproteobacteria bacterium]
MPLVVAACIANGTAGAVEDRLPPDVAAHLKSAGIPLTAVGIVVQEVGVSRPSLALNATRALNPASTMKLVSTYAALELLGPNFQWKTRAFAGGPMAGDVLEGDLVLKGGGDPKLTLESLWLFVRALRARGLREIRGDLVLDRTYFDAGEHDAARFDAEPLRPYNVGPDALLVNFKSVRFTFSPDGERGVVQVLAEPRPAQLELAQSVRIVEGPCNDWRTRLKADIQNGATGARVAFSGLYPASCGERSWNIALLGHPAYVHGVFRQIWEESGGVLRGSVRDGQATPSARLLCTQESPSLSEIVRDINKYSNNVMARQLFLTLSAELQKPPGSNGRSAEVVKAWLAQKRIEAPELVLENGSGLSRLERMSAANLARVLDAAFQSSVMPELMASLPLVASDGTMRRRLRYDSVAGQAHIKTGSLFDTRTIAGYVLDRLGRRQIIVFLINHPNAAAGQPAQDALLRRVYDRN